MKTLLPALSLLLVTCVTALSAGAEEVKGDAKTGAQKVALCLGCHGITGYRASFPEVYRVPMISGQGANYIVAALTAYKSGERKHPSMRGVAAGLSEQDIADVAAYYAAHGRIDGAPAPGKAPAGSARAAALIEKGACTACHGESLSQPIDPAYPKIAGQHADYLFVALKSYKAEGHSTWGRANPIMGGIAKQFSNAELKELANYLSTLPGELKTVPQAKFR